MINLTITIDDISSVISIFDKVDMLRYTEADIPSTPIDLNDYTTVLGIDHVNSREDVSDILLNNRTSQYLFTDLNGTSDYWYISRYASTIVSGTTSGWSDPVQGDVGDLYYNPVYPPEIAYGTSDKKVITYIRRLIGDPVGLVREYGSEAASSIHPDGRVYEFDEHGWPASINMYGKQYNEITNPTVNGYKFLRFQEAIDATITTVSGVEYSVDIWYYTFRNSDRQIMEAYDNTFPPTPLNITNCTPEIYMLQSAYDLLTNETWEAISEDGATIVDEGSTYNPAPGLNSRDKMLAKLRKRLDDAIRSVKLLGISGVRVD